MLLLKLGIAAFLFLVGLGLGFLFALVGLWSALAFALFAPLATIIWMWKHGVGRARVYFLAFSASLVLEAVLLVLATDGLWMGMRRIMDGYAAPDSTQAFLALVPLAVYLWCVSRWSSKPKPEEEVRLSPWRAGESPVQPPRK